MLVIDEHLLVVKEHVCVKDVGVDHVQLLLPKARKMKVSKMQNFISVKYAFSDFG